MPSIVEKPTATRSNNLQWSGMCIKTPLDSDVDEKDLEVLIAFSEIIHPSTTFVHTGNWFVRTPGCPGIPANQLSIHIYGNSFKFYIFGTQVQKRSSLSVNKWLNISIIY